MFFFIITVSHVIHNEWLRCSVRCFSGCRWWRACTHYTWCWLEWGNWQCQIPHLGSTLHRCRWSARNSRQGILLLLVTCIQINCSCLAVAFISPNLVAEAKAVKVGFRFWVLKT